MLSESDELYLTQKQAECAAYIVAGATAKQCANELGISYRNIGDYINTIKNKIFHLTGNRTNKEELVNILKK
jgi:DNA-binding CsgD family transcriptional regulator